METALGSISKCPRCKTPFKEGEDKGCKEDGCGWPWPTSFTDRNPEIFKEQSHEPRRHK